MTIGVATLVVLVAAAAAAAADLVACDDDANCTATDACHTAVCDVDAKLCRLVRDWTCCLSNASLDHCYHPGGACVATFCNASQRCDLAPLDGCCTDDAQCRGADACSLAYCDAASGQCRDVAARRPCLANDVDVNHCVVEACNATTGACNVVDRLPSMVKCPGACCFEANATCAELPADACSSAGGTWLDSSVACSPTACPAPP